MKQKPPTPFVSSTKAARAWGVSRSLVLRWCQQARIPGVFKVGRAWLIPADAKRPERRVRYENRFSTARAGE